MANNYSKVKYNKWLYLYKKRGNNNLLLELFVYTVRHTEALSHHLMTRSISSFSIPMRSQMSFAVIC